METNRDCFVFFEHKFHYTQLIQLYSVNKLTEYYEYGSVFVTRLNKIVTNDLFEQVGIDRTHAYEFLELYTDRLNDVKKAIETVGACQLFCDDIKIIKINLN